MPKKHYKIQIYKHVNYITFIKSYIIILTIKILKFNLLIQLNKL